MDPATGMVLAGAADLGGGLIGGAISGHMARTNMREQNRFNYQMAATAYQRAAADLALAGLNPVLAMGKIGGSSVPSASPSGPGMGSSSPGSTALATRMQNETFKNMEKQRLLMRAQTRREDDQASSYRASALANSALWQKTLDEAAGVNISNDILREQLKGWKIEGEIDSTAYGKRMREVDRALGAVRAGGDLVDSVVRKFLSGKGKGADVAPKNRIGF